MFDTIEDDMMISSILSDACILDLYQARPTAIANESEVSGQQRR